MLADFVRSNYVRGAITGLGIVNLVAGLVDLAGLMVDSGTAVGDRAAGPLGGIG